jgi:hypothetical protein
LVHGDGDLYGKGELHGEGKLQEEGEGELREGELDEEREAHEGKLDEERVHEGELDGERGVHEEGELLGVDEVQDSEGGLNGKEEFLHG